MIYNHIATKLVAEFGDNFTNSGNYLAPRIFANMLLNLVGCYKFKTRGVLTTYYLSHTQLLNSLKDNKQELEPLSCQITLNIFSSKLNQI